MLKGCCDRILIIHLHIVDIRLANLYFKLCKYKHNSQSPGIWIVSMIYNGVEQ